MSRRKTRFHSGLRDCVHICGADDIANANGMPAFRVRVLGLGFKFPTGACSGSELEAQVAQLKREYSRVGDQLESEQTRIMQARSRHNVPHLSCMTAPLIPCNYHRNISPGAKV